MYAATQFSLAPAAYRASAPVCAGVRMLRGRRPVSIPLRFAHRSSRASGRVAGLRGGGGCWHLVLVMSITVQLDLPEAVAAEAKAKGLLDPKNLTRLIQREVEAESARRDFFNMVRDLRALPGEPMTMDEIQSEVDAVRAERPARENRCWAFR